MHKYCCASQLRVSISERHCSDLIQLALRITAAWRLTAKYCSHLTLSGPSVWAHTGVWTEVHTYGNDIGVLRPAEAVQSLIVLRWLTWGECVAAAWSSIGRLGHVHDLDIPILGTGWGYATAQQCER